MMGVFDMVSNRSTVDTPRFCTQSGVCQSCPLGYSSDGYDCHECPYDQTCDSRGRTVCSGPIYT